MGEYLRLLYQFKWWGGFVLCFCSPIKRMIHLLETSSPDIASWCRKLYQKDLAILKRKSTVYFCDLCPKELSFVKANKGKSQSLFSPQKCLSFNEILEKVLWNFSHSAKTRIFYEFLKIIKSALFQNKTEQQNHLKKSCYSAICDVIPGHWSPSCLW